MIAYYVGVLVGALAGGVVVLVDAAGGRWWVAYAINCPLVMLGAWLVRSLM